MDFLNRIINLIKYTVCLISVLGFAQVEQKNSIALRDYHSAEITATLALKNYPYYITADASGKVLIHNSENKRVLKTIKPANDLPVSQMRLIHNDAVLVLNQKLDFTDGSQDSIISINVFDQKILNKFQGNMTFVGNQDDVLIVHSVNSLSNLNVVSLLDKSFKEIYKYYPKHKVTLAAYDSISKTMAMVESQFNKQNNITIQIGTDYKNAKHINIPQSLAIQDLFFDNEQLYALIANQETESVALYNLSKDMSFETSVFELADYSAKRVNVLKSRYKNKLQLCLTVKLGLSLRPIIIEKSAEEFKIIKPKTQGKTVNTVFLNTIGEYLFFEDYNFNSNILNAVRFEVYDTASNAITAQLPESSARFYQGLFLPDNNWLIVGKDSKVNSSKLHLKYYEAGTFKNRFGQLNFSDYLEVKHKVLYNVIENLDLLNKNEGVFPFYGEAGSDKNHPIKGFYEYNFIKDKLTLLSEKVINERQIIDYNSSTKQLLLSKEKYYNAGYTEPQDIVILNQDLKTKLDGLYKFAKFSNDGNYILLISDTNTVTVKKLTNLKTIYTEVLKDGKYEIFALDDSKFIVSNAYWELRMDACNKSSKLYTIDTDETVNIQDLNCVKIKDIAFKHNVFAVVIEAEGLIINDRVYKFPSSEFPEKIALSEDASRIMINFNNGKIRVYNTKELELLVEMLHPNNESHIFVDTENFYFSNTNPEDYLIATIDQKIEPISKLEIDYFNPAKILEHFGTPNENYLTLLNKALALRQDNLFNNTAVKSVDIITNTEVPLKKGDLYMLAVGVSNYFQSDYDLTYADKDALDMSAIYSTLDSLELQDYDTKFLGKPYKLNHDLKHNFLPINVYKGTYGSVGELKALNSGATIWLEHDYEKLYLWDYQTNTRQEKSWPNLSTNSYSLNSHLFVSPDNSGFFIYNDTNGFSEYTFSTDKFLQFQLPFNLEGYGSFSPELLQPLENRKWLHAKEIINDLTNTALLYYGETNGKVLDSISFSLNTYFEFTKKGDLAPKTAPVYNVTFRTCSSDGKHLLYTFENALFYVNLSHETIQPIRLNINEPIAYDTEFTISKDGDTIVIHSEENHQNSHSIKTYNLKGELKDHLVLNNENLSLKGWSIYNTTISYIESEEALAKDDFTTAETQKLFSKHKPSSFNQSFVNYLINEDATLANIKTTLTNLAKKVKPEDQIIVFMAGHGVLDEALNYYFAPYDMDFSQVSEKGMAFKSLVDLINLAPTQNKLLLLDSCHSGNDLDVNTGELRRTNESRNEGERGSRSRVVKTTSSFKLSDVISDVFDDFISKSGITIISASAAEDVAYENKDLGNGAFTAAFKEVLISELSTYSLGEDDLKKSIDLKSEHFSEILKKVMEFTKGKQIPDLREINANANLKMW